MERLVNIDVPQVSSLLTSKLSFNLLYNFNKLNFKLKDSIPFLNILLLNLGKCFGCVYQQKSNYRQVKITKHASTGTNYAILTKRVKVSK